ncbi:class I SAM-dependent methyltransferase [Vibrio sp. HB161653]|uniref:Class I SAM-dependent methyltransferase n=1 Tax=Vibrio sp. HB236076 TaxID=3232307 RepID=A0AB39HDN9_9VIBR|nr:class I SAM-dependent methyltransferase [Vibrio sp. HB161653]MDP5253611.1 class I SAM-dependent methyltransferase [Vibrio sp. HB161653]
MITLNISALQRLEQHLIEQLALKPNQLTRLFHGRGRFYLGLEQITVDWVNQTMLVQLFKCYDGPSLERLQSRLRAISLTQEWQQAGGEHIVIQHRYLADNDLDVVVGELIERQIGYENGLAYHLTLGKNQNMGLFLDMKAGREWVKQHSHGKKVLNLFAYTCGFSVAAVAGGASSVVNIDMAKGALATGRKNHQLNPDHDAKVHFFAHDIFRSWGKIKKYGPYDLIVIDPPSFQKGSFALTKDYQKILRRLADLQTADGQVLACVNAPDVDSHFLIDSMATHAPQFRFIERLDNPSAFVDSNPESALKVLHFASQV